MWQQQSTSPCTFPWNAEQRGDCEEAAVPAMQKTAHRSVVAATHLARAHSYVVLRLERVLCGLHLRLCMLLIPVGLLRCLYQPLAALLQRACHTLAARHPASTAAKCMTASPQGMTRSVQHVSLLGRLHQPLAALLKSARHALAASQPTSTASK